MSWLKKTYYLLFIIGLFFIPFNDFDGLGFLGEFRSESAVLFFLTGSLLLFSFFLLGKRMRFPLKNFYYHLFLIFFAWCFLATLFNIFEVKDNYFKHTGGISRFFRQYISLILSAVVLFTFYWNVLREMTWRQILHTIRTVFLCSLIFTAVFGLLETLIVYFHVYSVGPLLDLFDYFPFLNTKVYGDRISSITQESPYLAIYLITVAGWMFSYILTSKGIKRFIPTFLILELTFFSGSRTGMIVIFAQLLVFLVVLFSIPRYRKYVYILIVSCIVVSGTAIAINPQKAISEINEKVKSLNFSNLTANVSNQTRFGIQSSNIKVAMNHPIIGVGFGQQTYYNRFHYPVWATYNNYEFSMFFKDPDWLSFPPGYNMYLRILAETGIIGLGLFLLFLGSILWKCIQLISASSGEKKILSIILLISFVGLDIIWLQLC